MRFVGLFAAVAALVACNRPRYTYEPRPPSPSESRCVRDSQVAIATGTFSWTRNIGSPTTVSRGAGGEMVLRYGPAQSELYGNTGIVMYRGDRRFSALEALEAVGAREAAATQRRLLDQTAGAHAVYPVVMTTTWILAGGGTAAVAVGGAIVLSDPSSESNTGAYLMLGGLSALAVSLIPAVIGYVKLPDRIRHQRDKKLILHPEIARAGAEAAARANRRQAAACGAQVGATPTSERARALLSR